MPDDIAQLHAWIDAHRAEMVEALRGCLRIPSKKEPPAGEGAPFGLPIRQALDYTLDLCRSLGFRVADVDGYAGHAEFGEGQEMVAALGHLDVVPEGDRWRHGPFDAEVDSGFLYGRGASDDKGPTYAALFAAKALMDCGVGLRRRVRVIFGCDEESGFGCMTHYFGEAAQERPVYAFTPDAVFPVIFAEKGIANLTLERRVEGQSAALRVTEVEGGRRANMVPDLARGRVEGDPAALYTALVTLANHWDRNVEAEPDANGVTVRATGKSAHGSTPQDGDNAIARLARALLTLDLPDDRGWLSWAARSADPTGGTLGIAGSDDVAGPLTSNLGLLEMQRGMVRLVYNIRYPVTWAIGGVLARLQPVIQEAGWTLAHHTDSPPLHVPLDQEPARTLVRVYREETGDTESRPETMGGGTYARATPHALAFGAAFPGGSDGPAHEPEERIALESLVKAAKIYAHAFYELCR